MSAVVYSAIACFGFLTFGGNSSSYILNNYSPHDPLATVSRLAVGLSTLVAYPIVFMGVRDGFIDIFEISLADQEKIVNEIKTETDKQREFDRKIEEKLHFHFTRSEYWRKTSLTLHSD